MKHRVSIVAVLACACCLALALAGCTQSTYRGKTLSPTVSTPTIGQSGTLRVGVDTTGGAPFVVSSNGTTTGLDVDMAAALAEQLGLKLEIVDVEGNAASALSAGTVDIVMTQSSSEKNSNMWLSDPYIETGVALFAPLGTTAIPTSSSGAKIAAQTSSTSAWTVENAFGSDSLSSMSDLMSAFTAVNQGTVDYVASDAVIGTYAAMRQGIDVQPIALLGTKGGYCIGVSSSNKDLQTAVSKALSTISSNGVAEVVQTKWLGSAINLDSLTTIEVSSSKSSSSTSETVSTSTAGANAVIQGSNSSN